MLYGRLADPDCTLGDDPRADPRMVKLLAQFGLDGSTTQESPAIDSPLQERLAWAVGVEDGFTGLFQAFAEGMPVSGGVTTQTVTIAAGDGNDVTLYISRPTDAEAALPAVVHLHGGGMAILRAGDTMACRAREHLASTGVVVVGVEFRNSGGKWGPHPYPAGLNDCAAAVRWVFAKRAELGVSHVVVSGESGGGNLTLTIAHKAKREGWLNEIAGLYAQCPMVSNRWLEDADDLPSLKENDGYLVSCKVLALLGSLYNPDESYSGDATCWASAATDEELTGLPPHVISVNELDPMRDEGLEYYRRLVRAGVPAVGRVVAGTCHGGDLMMPSAMPEVFDASMRDVSGFAKSLA